MRQFESQQCRQRMRSGSLIETARVYQLGAIVKGINSGQHSYTSGVRSLRAGRRLMCGWRVLAAYSVQILS